MCLIAVNDVKCDSVTLVVASKLTINCTVHTSFVVFCVLDTVSSGDASLHYLLEFILAVFRTSALYHVLRFAELPAASVLLIEPVA